MSILTKIKHGFNRLGWWLVGKEKHTVWNRLRQIYITSMDHRQYAEIGEHCDLGTEQTTIPSRVYMEDYSRLQNHFNFIAYRGKLRVKKYAAVGSGCIVIPGDHVPTVGVPQYLAGKLHINDVDGEIVIGEDAWVGAGTILLSHCQIGRGAVVAAGAVVSKVVPPYAVVAGVPAKIIAVRFTKEQIMQHEATLYPQEERMSSKQLDQLFNEYFQDCKSIGRSDMTDDDRKRLIEAKQQLGMLHYEG